VAKKGKGHKKGEAGELAAATGHGHHAGGAVAGGGASGGPASAAPAADALGEAAFLAEYDASAFPHPSLTVDVVLLTATDDALHALLVKRDRHPEMGKWALPGGFIQSSESLDSAAARVVQEKTGLGGVFLEQLYTFGAPARDPRTRVLTVAYYALVTGDRLAAAGASGGGQAQLARLRVPWVGELGGPVEALDAGGASLPLAFDHAEILGMAVKRLRGKLDYAPIGFELLPEVFSLRALQQIHEVISGRHFNKDSFRRRMLASGQLEATGERRTDVEYRPPELYRFVGGGQG
jgi:8-oxo-dGTP diphosphatase